MMTLSTRLTHDESAGHLDGGVGQAAVPLLPEDVLRLRSRAHLLAVQLNLTVQNSDRKWSFGVVYAAFLVFRFKIRGS